MTLTEVAKELSRIRAACHSRSQLATETDLSRLLAKIEKDEKELDDEWNSLLRGENLVNVDLDITYQLVRN